MPKIVEVPGVGNVEFPDTMGDDQIGAVLSKTNFKPPERDLTTGERLRYALHKTAGLLPAAGGIAGGFMGGGLGAALGFPTTGPGGIATTAAGGALGAGLLSAGGKSLQHAADVSLGYEEDPGIESVLVDSAKTGARDAAYTGAGGMILPTAAAAAGKFAPILNAMGNKLGRRVLNGGATPLTVKTPLSDEAIDAARAAGAFKPWGTTKSASAALDTAREETGAEYARIVAELEKQGVAAPEIPALAKQYLAKASNAQLNTGNPAVPAVYESAADMLMKSPGPRTLTQIENVKRSMQGMAKSSYQKLDPTEVGETHEDAASMLRQAIEDSIGQQAQATRAARRNPALQEAADSFVPIKEKLGPIIEASNAATRGAAMADRRQAFSLTDMLAATAGAHGGPIEAAGAGLASKALRTFGPSAGTWASKGAADILRNIGTLPAAVPAQAGAAAGAAAEEAPSPGELLRRLLAAAAQIRSQPQPVPQ